MLLATYILYMCYYIYEKSYLYVFYIHLSIKLLIHFLIYIYIYLFTYLSIYLFIPLFIHLFIYLFIYLLIYLFTYLNIHLFIYLFIYLSIYFRFCLGHPDEQSSYQSRAHRKDKKRGYKRIKQDMYKIQ